MDKEKRVKENWEKEIRDVISRNSVWRGKPRVSRNIELKIKIQQNIQQDIQQKPFPIRTPTISTRPLLEKSRTGEKKKKKNTNSLPYNAIKWEDIVLLVASKSTKTAYKKKVSFTAVFSVQYTFFYKKRELSSEAWFL